MQASATTRMPDKSTTLPIACLFGTASAHPPRSTGKERDAESGLDYFYARYYSSTLGRFMTPDFDDLDDDDPEPVPYADPDDPQSLNLYVYVGNNPNIWIDFNGHVGDAGSDDVTEEMSGEAEEEAAAGASAGNGEDGYMLAAGSGSDYALGAPSDGTGANAVQGGALPHPVETVTVSDGSCSTDLCKQIASDLWKQLTNPTVPALHPMVYSKAHGKGERNRAAKPSGTGNEEKINKKARWNSKGKYWWMPDADGKEKRLPNYKPSKEQLEKAGLVAAGTAAGGIALSTVLETAGGLILAF